MSADPERIRRLGMAAAFCMFDRKLRSSGNGSIIWGLLSLAIGGFAVAAHNNWGIVSVILGLALIVEGVYERSVRDPKVIIVSAATLGTLALWHFALIGLAAMGKAELALGGRTLFWAIAQAGGAFATWKTYSTYKELRDGTDPLVVEQVRGNIEELNKAKPDQSLDVVEFDVNAGFVQGTKRFRLKPIEDLYMVADYKVQLGRMHLQEVTFIPRNEVTLSPEGSKWMSKKIRASVQLGPVTLKKVSITSDMAARINPAAGMIALGAT
jgi:hypothetical protein